MSLAFCGSGGILVSVVVAGRRIVDVEVLRMSDRRICYRAGTWRGRGVTESARATPPPCPALGHLKVVPDGSQPRELPDP